MVIDGWRRARVTRPLDRAERDRSECPPRARRDRLKRHTEGFEEDVRSSPDLATEYQLRRYRIRARHMDEFLEAWLRGVYPLRRKFGFVFAGAWRVEDAEEFVWIIGYDGPDGFAVADKRYYESAERKGMSPDPAQYIETPVSQMMRSVLPD
jgi:hypothetical protein